MNLHSIIVNAKHVPMDFEDFLSLILCQIFSVYVN